MIMLYFAGLVVVLGIYMCFVSVVIDYIGTKTNYSDLGFFLSLVTLALPFFVVIQILVSLGVLH